MIIKGKAMWAKVLAPVPNYAKDGFEYTLDLTLEPSVVAELEEAGLGEKVKTGKYDAPHIKFQLPTKSRKGQPLSAPEVVDVYGTPWPETTLIGNGSTLNVRFDIRKGEFNGKPWAKPGLRGVQVVDLVEVDSSGSFEYEPKPEGGSDSPVDESWT